MKEQDILENQVNKVYLSLGTNLGKKKINLELAKFLLNSSGINVIKTSSFYHSKSWPNENFPEYLNIILLVNTKLRLIELFNKIKFIEKKMGRIKKPKNYPRICDIDIIDFNSLSFTAIYLSQKIKVPHESMHKRNFVLLPLYEISKNWIHPKFKKNIVKLISSLSFNDLRSIKFS